MDEVRKNGFRRSDNQDIWYAWPVFIQPVLLFPKVKEVKGSHTVSIDLPDINT